VNTAISQEQQKQRDLAEQIEQSHAKIVGLEKELEGVQAELEALSGQREQYRLLSEVCESLEKLTELGAAPLFWGEREEEGARQLRQARERADNFEHRIAGIDERRDEIERSIKEEHDRIDDMHQAIYWAKVREERRKEEFVVEREISGVPHRQTVMPWSHDGEADKRYRKFVAIAFVVSMVFGYLIPLWELPPPKKEEEVVPERLAKLVKERKPKPPPEKPKPKKEEKPKDKDKKKNPSKKKPTEAEKKKARKKAEGSGVLAFKDSFSDMLDNAPDAKLGAKARVSNKGKTSGKTRRDIVAQEAQSTSGGINSSSLSRNTAGTAGKGIEGTKFSRVDSAIGTDMQGGADRPLSDGPGPSRTDEEIQIVFDRYKATLYRIYNRQLRRNPTLQGKMVLRITIQPDGSVSAVKVDSSDLDSPTLSKKIVARVKRFNFGPKEGTPPTTILYPIDFLPAG